MSMSSRGLPITKKIRAERRAVAEASLADYNKLTLEQKLNGLPPEPGAAKQRARLLALVNKKQEKVEVEAAVAIAKESAKEEKVQKKAKKAQR
jgi:hypothetical protein